MAPDFRKSLAVSSSALERLLIFASVFCTTDLLDVTGCQGNFQICLTHLQRAGCKAFQFPQLAWPDIIPLIFGKGKHKDSPIPGAECNQRAIAARPALPF